MEQPTTAGRQQNGTFAPGFQRQSPGRAKGTKNRATRIAEALLEGEARALVRKAIDLALAGDVVAIKLCLERVLPRRHERTLTFACRPVTAPKDAAAALAAIVRGVGTGDLAPGEAKASLVEAALKGIEVIDHEKRLTALEETRGKTTETVSANSSAITGRRLTAR